MDALYGWVSNIVYYLILVTMIINLLPAGKYEKYLRLFAGCILILLVIKPVTNGLRLEEKISGAFKTLSFENEVGELRLDMQGMEDKRMKELTSRYEVAAAEDIGRMAGREGFINSEVSVEIEEEKDSPDFGKIKQITVLLTDTQHSDMTAADGQTADGKTSQSNVPPVETVKVETIHMEAMGGNTSEPPSSKVSAGGKAERAEVKKLKQEIAGFYQVEERYVEIRLENE